MPNVCSQLLSGGTCENPSCTYRHNVSTCDICSLVFGSPNDYTAHIATKQHVAKARGESGTLLFCSPCQKHVSGTKNWAQHVAAARHKAEAKLKGLPADADPEEVESVPGRTLCSTCNIHIHNNDWERHQSAAKHLARQRFVSFRTALDEAERDKNGLSIVGDFDFGIVDGPAAKSGKTIRPTIKNLTPSSKISIVSMTLASDKGSKTQSPFSVVHDPNRTIGYNATYSFAVTLRQNHNGRAEDRLEILFEDLQLRKRFIIARILRVIVGNRSDHETLRPVAPYKPRKRTARQPETDVVEGIHPPSLKAVPYVVALPKALIPANLASALSTGSTKSIVDKIRSLFLPSVLDSDTYARHFKTLVWSEEFRMERDLEHYDIPNAKLTVQNYYHLLDVPGLAEKRPSVLVGDRILVQKSGGANPGHWFEGGVHFVRKEEVGLRFHGSFRASPADRFNVRFKLNRHPLRRQHLALNTVYSEDRVLFPLPLHVPTTSYPTQARARLGVFNPLIATNAPQLQAVVSIVKRPPGSVPFVIFGPPGTGKTVTMVEAIRQLLAADPHARILACAPSNSAADLIATRLMSLNTDELFRFYAPSRNREQVPLDLREYTYEKQAADYTYEKQNAEKRHFSVPPLARMKRFRVVVLTCVSASVVSGIGMPRGHYTHIFFDEAGQATEAESMIAIKTMADTKTNIVLSGDPKQLGPIIRSAVARELGLETSYIERLMQREIYDEKKGYGASVVKLVKNFRSHAAILKFPNERFYGGELQPCGDSSIINAYLNSPLLPNKAFPIVFHAIAGKDEREAASPSFFNRDEASQVKEYITKLRADRRFRITDNDIGVITPYHAQCLKIRNVLRAVADEVKVGSVEEFQGQERRVIIISAVRSSREFVEYDLRHTLGFVANPRRFNVAVTRAQALLIVVGDPDVLALDPLWRAFLNYVYLHGGWTGGDISWDPARPVDEAGGYDGAVRAQAEEDMNAFTRRMEELTIAGAEAEAEEDGANVDRPWQDVE
ncbi:P-loop containing nucleoside triphosphate hydrolase protein [Mycena albidolilacea]|uniref:RNA helicase n=1 Tax=Mycena albidolilacea TaxID=1033008 RepID=A0AAD7EHX1_9AGAR|nr:P-loop containing nucleoside triphosphate hydrolase protein [Mycena albidolilacea]